MNKLAKIKKYLQNCFWLTIPILVWNVFLADDLPGPLQPETFRNSIPLFLAIGEQTFRIIIFVLTLRVPLSFRATMQKTGLIIYVMGVLIDFVSLLALIYYPQSKWSNSFFGFLSPAYTAVLWLTGIALIGDKFYFNLPYRKWMFIALSIVFLLFHNIHTSIIYHRIHWRTQINILLIMACHLKKSRITWFSIVVQLTRLKNQGPKKSHGLLLIITRTS